MQKFLVQKICWSKIYLGQKSKKQAGVELCQAQVKLEVLVEFGVEVEVCYY